MNIDIRSHIVNNFKNDNKEALEAAIIDSIKENDDETLPGLGVFFELVWNNADNDIKNTILSILEEAVKSNE